MQSILERLDAGLLLLEEKGKNLVARLSELRGKLHQSETRAAQRDGELERLRDGAHARPTARLKALYGQLGELRKESEASRKARMAAEEELAGIAAETRRARKQLEDARAALAKAEQALAAATLEEELLASRAEQVREQRQGAHATLSARRSRLENLDAQLAHAQARPRAGRLATSTSACACSTRAARELETRREALAAARAEMRGLEEVDRAFAAAAPALAWAISREKRAARLRRPGGRRRSRARAPRDARSSGCSAPTCSACSSRTPTSAADVAAALTRTDRGRDLARPGRRDRGCA